MFEFRVGRGLTFFESLFFIYYYVFIIVYDFRFNFWRKEVNLEIGNFLEDFEKSDCRDRFEFSFV